MKDFLQRNNKGQFTKGNTISHNNRGGRPKFFETPKDFQKAINDYQDSISTKDKNGRREFFEMPTLSGLPRYAGCSRETIRTTINRSTEYSDLYKVFKAVCEHHLEKVLYRTNGSVYGAIFTLRRHYEYKA